ncbi:MAG: thiamine-binding protein, partial [Acidimicrobiia bacterium]
EGDWDEVMDVIRRCVEAVAGRAPRVSVVIKLDHRPGTGGALRGKVESVERRLAPGGGGEWRRGETR